ncbi:hypothetical protein HPP92_004595 [Vanilla planifolia]|uniref:Uncharacterized protein n=1 Tax=Vanilla planifolia TaxID=51239 RepID=A0A835S210_VANPL|nr:hypothetical protein HPP92_004595 [Vanilla planifolia]
MGSTELTSHARSCLITDALGATKRADKAQREPRKRGRAGRRGWAWPRERFFACLHCRVRGYRRLCSVKFAGFAVAEERRRPAKEAAPGR